jgi:SAM-dependent methyltransferase
MGLRVSVRARIARWFAHSKRVDRMRERRYRLFMELCAVQPDETILDVGAGLGGALARFNPTNPIVALDVRPPVGPNWLDSPNVEFVEGNATRLPFDDGAFPVAFSNAVIQYVSKDELPSFASEIRRVSDRYYVQTQSRWFPVRTAPATLTAGDLRRLFPDAEIHRERVLGVTKSIMAVRRKAASREPL